MNKELLVELNDQELENVDGGLFYLYKSIENPESVILG
jgi:hypothetical protein